MGNHCVEIICCECGYCECVRCFDNGFSYIPGWKLEQYTKDKKKNDLSKYTWCSKCNQKSMR